MNELKEKGRKNKAILGRPRGPSDETKPMARREPDVRRRASGVNSVGEQHDRDHDRHIGSPEDACARAHCSNDQADFPPRHHAATAPSPFRKQVQRVRSQPPCRRLQRKGLRTSKSSAWPARDKSLDKPSETKNRGIRRPCPIA